MRQLPLTLCLVLLASTSQAQSLTVAASPRGMPLVGSLAIGTQPVGPQPGYLPGPSGYGAGSLPGQNPLGSIQAAEVAAQKQRSGAPEASALSLLDEATQNPSPTASEQGADFTDPAAEAQALADEMARHTARQEGRTQAPPGPANPVAADRTLAPWVHAWAGLLINAGVSGAKIRFEANRLDATAFAHWASRQLQASPTATLVFEDTR